MARTANYEAKIETIEAKIQKKKDEIKKLKEEFDKISEDEQVIARMYDADSIEVIKKEVMSWHDDANSSTTAIALI